MKESSIAELRDLYATLIKSCTKLTLWFSFPAVGWNWLTDEGRDGDEGSGLRISNFSNSSPM